MLNSYVNIAARWRSQLHKHKALLLIAVGFNNCGTSLVVTEWWFRIYISRFWHSTWTQHTVKQIVRPCSTTENTDWCASRPLGVVYSGYSRELTSSACVCACVCGVEPTLMTSLSRRPPVESSEHQTSVQPLNSREMSRCKCRADALECTASTKRNRTVRPSLSPAYHLYSRHW